MPVIERAKQFSPFQSLSGYDNAIRRVEEEVLMENEKDKKRELFERQKSMLETLLEHGAISNEQFEKSLNGLIEKMGVEDASEAR